MVLQTKAFEFEFKLTPQATANQSVIELYTPSTEDNGVPTRYSALLETLRIKTEIGPGSITESAIPEGLDDLGTAEAHEAYKEYQWNAQRFELAILYKIGEGDWIERFRLPLINRQPYFIIDVLPYFTRQVSKRMANGARLGAKLIDAGFGFPLTTDTITIFGEGLEEADLVQLSTNEGQYEILRGQVDSLSASVTLLSAATTEMVTKLNQLLVSGMSAAPAPAPSPSPSSPEPTPSPTPEPAPAPTPAPADPFSNADPNAGFVLVEGDSVLVDGDSVLVELN